MELEEEGLTTSDAQGVADLEVKKGLIADSVLDWNGSSVYNEYEIQN